MSLRKEDPNKDGGGKDFISLQETHGSPGRGSSFDDRFSLKYSAFRPHLTKSQGGVGFILKKDFLQKFNGSPT